MTARAWIAVAALGGLPGCAAVPTLTFEEGDASAADAGDAGPSADAQGNADAACPQQAPPNATCCGPVPCFGSFCTTANCSLCKSRCSAMDLCCSTMNAVSCHAPPYVCR